MTELEAMTDQALWQAWAIAARTCRDLSGRANRAIDRGDDLEMVRALALHRAWHVTRAGLEAEAMRRGFVLPPAR